MSTGTLVKPNTASVVRDGTSYVFFTSPFTGDNNGIMQVTAEDDLFDAKETIVTVDREMARTIENTPLAATVVWDNTQINLYYFVPSTDGAFLREICQKDNGDWIEGALSKYLVEEGVFPAADSTLTVWTDKENIHVYFKSKTDGERELTLAKYFAESSSWQIKRIKFGPSMGIAA